MLGSVAFQLVKNAAAVRVDSESSLLNYPRTDDDCIVIEDENNNVYHVIDLEDNPEVKVDERHSLTFVDSTGEHVELTLLSVEPITD